MRLQLDNSSTRRPHLLLRQRAKHTFGKPLGDGEHRPKCPLSGNRCKHYRETTGLGEGELEIMHEPALSTRKKAGKQEHGFLVHILWGRRTYTITVRSSMFGPNHFAQFDTKRSTVPSRVIVDVSPGTLPAGAAASRRLSAPSPPELRRAPFPSHPPWQPEQVAFCYIGKTRNDAGTECRDRDRKLL